MTAPRPQATEPLLTMEGVVKRYGPTLALDSVRFEAQAGEIHAILGENGAGKSTLMRILAGLTAPDAGAIRWHGKPVRIESPRAARRLGIAMVHQHFTLVPAFTVAETLALDAGGTSEHPRLREPQGARRGPTMPAALSWSARRAAEPAIERAAELGWSLDSLARIRDLSVGERQRVEIARALAPDADLVVFDEPTAVLPPGEVRELLGVLQRLRDAGRAVVLITHKLTEALDVSDRITVLRRGRVVAETQTSRTTADQLAASMFGAEPAAASHMPAAVQGAAPALIAHDIVVAGDRGNRAVRGISLEARYGELVGIGGVDGNGQVELAEALTGIRPLLSGSVTLHGARAEAGSTGAPRIGYIPEDRRRAGLALEMSVAENLVADAIHESVYRRGPFLRRRALDAFADRLAAEFDIRAPSLTATARSLSGGNQQKVVVARALGNDPEIIVAVNPTRGLDIAATQYVHDRLREARARGAALIVISADTEELLLLADRMAILSRGRITPYDPGTAGPDELGLLMGGAARSGAPRAG